MSLDCTSRAVLSTAIVASCQGLTSEQLAHCNKLINSDNISKMSTGATVTPATINRENQMIFLNCL